MQDRGRTGTHGEPGTSAWLSGLPWNTLSCSGHTIRGQRGGKDPSAWCRKAASADSFSGWKTPSARAAGLSLPLQLPTRVGKPSPRGPRVLHVEVSAALSAVCSSRPGGRSSLFLPRPGHCGPRAASKEPCVAGDGIRANLRPSGPATEAAGGRAPWLRPVIWGRSKQMISWGLSLSIKACSIV